MDTLSSNVSLPFLFREDGSNKIESSEVSAVQQLESEEQRKVRSSVL